MNILPTCQFVIDAARDGAWNMALDEALLNAAVQTGDSTLRFYSWSEPTISMGHFQPGDDPVVLQRFPALSRVRRLSGGGAILHHHELTYSCALPANHPLSRNPGSIYDRVHEALIAGLAELGVTSTLRGAPQTGPAAFLCFSRGDSRDIVIGPHKIVGSAQRRRQGAVLQHGSILLSASEFAPEFPGIQELTGVALTTSRLAAQLLKHVPSVLGTTKQLAAWPEEILNSATELLPQYRL